MDQDNITKLLKGHSDRYLEMALRQERRVRLPDPDGHGKHTGECGDTIEIFLRIRDGRILRAAFDTIGCLNTAVCANTVATLSEGKTVEEAWDLSVEDVVDDLETLPVGHFHCAELAVGAFYRALSNYSENSRSPWKRIYRT